MATIISNGSIFVAVRNKVEVANEAPDGFDELIGSVDGMQMLAINLGPPGASVGDIETMALMRNDDGSFEWKDITEVGQTAPKSAVVRLLRDVKRDENDGV